MNQNYLWDKTGHDPEIEQLENALKAFRYQEKAPPAIPAPAVRVEPHRARRTFRFRLAFAASIAFLLAASGLWLQFAGGPAEGVGADHAAITTPLNDVPPANSPALPRPASLPAEPEKDRSPAAVTRPEKVRHRVPPASRRAIRPENRRSPPAVRLTEEEDFAYRQLMLALSITSSKLKLVKDKVEGSDEQTAAVQTSK